jgi:hypothetical protein
VSLRPAERAVVAFAAGPVLVVVALKWALELAVAGRYGWHRDELYYAVAGPIARCTLAEVWPSIVAMQS